MEIIFGFMLGVISATGVIIISVAGGRPKDRELTKEEWKMGMSSHRLFS